MSKTKTTQQKTTLNLVNVLPDNRPITSLQIVEDQSKCPKNFKVLHRTFDTDTDADLWRENNILFGRRTTRYLCLSKSEGLPDYVIETLKIIGDKEVPPDGYSLLHRTADTEQKAWRKKKISYKLTKRIQNCQAVTDIVLCSKLKQPPKDFTSAGEINGILVCYKMTQITIRPLPDLPTEASLIERIEELKIVAPLYPVPPKPCDADYVNVAKGGGPISPKRPAPKPPIAQTGTLYSSGATDMEGVPFILNPSLIAQSLKIPAFTVNDHPKLDYDFLLERQILCTTKSRNSTNPFFQ